MQRTSYLSAKALFFVQGKPITFCLYYNVKLLLPDDMILFEVFVRYI